MDAIKKKDKQASKAAVDVAVAKFSCVIEKLAVAGELV